MSLLNFLGLDDLAEGVHELTAGLDELREEIIDSIIEPSEDLKGALTDISDTVQGK